jgi:hypothetical protein
VSGGLDGVEADGETECVGLLDDAAHRAFGIEPSEVVAAEIVVVDVVGEHVPDRGEDRVFDGDNGFLLAESRREASVAGTEGGFAWVATTASEVDGSLDKQPHHRQPLVRPPRRHMRVIDRPVPMGIRQASPACRDCRTCCEWRLGACRKAQVGRPFHPSVVSGSHHAADGQDRGARCDLLGDDSRVGSVRAVLSG